MAKEVISGVAIKTFGNPPNLGIFASMSPNVLDTYSYKLTFTDNLPGNTRCGPTKI